MTKLPVKPLPPESGEPQDLLMHAVRYGKYCAELENKLLILDTWRKD